VGRGGRDDDDSKSLGVVDEGTANVAIDGNCDVGSKITGGCTPSAAQMESQDKV